MKKEKTGEKNALLGRFEDYLLARGRKSAGRYLQVAGLFLEANPGELEPFEAHHVNRFLARLSRRAKGRTLRWNYYVVKSFFRALGYPWPFDSGEVPKADENEDVPVFTQGEMQALEKTAKSHKNKEAAARNYAIVRLENALGLRRGELRNLNIDDYDKPHIRVETLKGGRTVQRALDPETCHALDEWIKIRRRKRSQADSDALFTRGAKGPRLSLRGLNYIVKAIREKAGIEKEGAGFHASRRGRVTDLSRRGVSGPALTKEWGWKGRETVNTYIRYLQGEVEEAIQGAHPYFQELGEEEQDGDEEVVKLLRDLSPEAQRNILEIIMNPPEVEA